MHERLDRAALTARPRDPCQPGNEYADFLRPSPTSLRPSPVVTDIIELAKLAHENRRWLPFGEFLVERQVLSRFQLFRLLQYQDRVRGLRIGQCAVELGFIRPDELEELHRCFADHVPDVETLTTAPFHRSQAL
jgi:hypothetical protein